MTRELTQEEIDFVLHHAAINLLAASEQARLLAHIQAEDLSDESVLFAPTSAPEYVYLLMSGTIATEQQTYKTSDFLASELLLGATSHRHQALVKSAATVMLLPVPVLQEMVSLNPDLRAFLYRCSMPRQEVSAETAQEASLHAITTIKVAENHGQKKVSVKDLAGWSLAIVIPILVWFLADQEKYPPDTCYFLGIFSCVILMWIFNLMPAFVPPFFSILAIILFDVAKPSVAVAGYASSGFFMLLSVFSIGALMVMSGLTYRISLLILKAVPNNWLGYNLSLLGYGLLLTPIIPSQLGRTIILAPFLSHLIDACSNKKQVYLSSAFFVNAIGGIGLLSSIFLTGKPANLIVFGLFDSQTQLSFEWLFWLSAAAFTGVLLLALQILAAKLMFREANHFSIPKHVISSQLNALGSMSTTEWGAVIASVVIVVGILTAPYHGIEIPWLSLTILVTLLLFGLLKNEDLNRRIDWSVLIFIGAIIAWVPVMKHLGLDREIADSGMGFGDLMKSHLFIFITLLSLCIVLLRLLLPELVIAILLVTFLFPIAAAAGVSQWLIGFVILTMSESYIFPYQTPYHMMLESQLKQLPASYQPKRIVRFNLLMTFARLLAILASFPFWSFLDII